MYEKYEALLVKYNKTSYQVAKETGTATATFSDWECGKYAPKIDKLILIANYFGVTITYFLN